MSVQSLLTSLVTVIRLVGADGSAVNERLSTENSNGRIKQGEQEPGNDQHQAGATAVTLAKHRT